MIAAPTSKFWRECGQCLTMAICLPVNMQCVGHRFSLQMCLRCRLEVPDRNHMNAACTSRRDEWIHLPRVWPHFAATGDDQLRLP